MNTLQEKINQEINKLPLTSQKEFSILCCF